jgi:AraC family transcriptional activator of tynA and feaB
MTNAIRQCRRRITIATTLTTRLIEPIRVEDYLTLSLLAKLPSLAGKMNPISEEMVGSHALDLAAVSLAMTIDGRQPRVSSGKALVVLNIRSTQATLESAAIGPKIAFL